MSEKSNSFINLLGMVDPGFKIDPHQILKKLFLIYYYLLFFYEILYVFSQIFMSITELTLNKILNKIMNE